MKTFKEFINESSEWKFEDSSDHTFIGRVPNIRNIINGIEVLFTCFESNKSWQCDIQRIDAPLDYWPKFETGNQPEYKIDRLSVMSSKIIRVTDNDPIRIIKFVKKYYNIDIPYTGYKQIQKYLETPRK